MTLAERKAALKAMRICRFCLTEKEPLSSIYDRENRSGKNSIPLPLQIMACVSIEMFPSDGMPQLLCDQCRLQTTRSYKFKTFCKQSDDALKLFLATGNLSKPAKSIAEILELSESEIQQERPLKTDIEEPPLKRIKINESVEDMEEGEILREEYIEEEYVPAESDNTNALLYEEYEELDDSELEEMHAMNMTNEKPIVPDVPLNIFSCTQCERSFPLQQLLDIHMANHDRERKFQCSRCDKLFFSKYDLAKHETVHTGEKPYQCVVCLKTFARPTLLHRHEKIHVDIPKYLCNTCDRTFLTKEELDRHEATHRKNRPFACDKCDKSFAFKQGLERHQEIHRVDKPHKCNYCEQSFDTPPKLARHVTSHAGMRPYPCKFCQRTFLLSHHLTRHMRGHYTQQNLNKPHYNYKCSECTMQFKRKDGLIGHSTIHSMVSLKCIFCFKQFEDLTLVREHVKTHMYGRIFPCEKCSYSFITQKHLEDHDAAHCSGEGDSTGNEENSQESTSKDGRDLNLFEDSDILNDEEDKSMDTEQSPGNSAGDDSNIRRSRRTQKIKNYAQFIKTELGLEAENEADQESESQLPDEDIKSEEEIEEPKPKVSPSKDKSKKIEETIKPIVKPDGTKTYASKGTKKTPSVKPTTSEPTTDTTPASPPVTPETSTQSIDLPVNKVTKGEIMEMKIGDKIVKVQKVLMTKAEVEEMARQGKIKMKGGAMLLQQPSKTTVDTTKLPSPVPTKKPSTEVKATKKASDSQTKATREDKSKEDSPTTSKTKENKEETTSPETRKSVRTYTKKGQVASPTKKK